MTFLKGFCLPIVLSLVKLQSWLGMLLSNERIVMNLFLGIIIAYCGNPQIPINQPKLLDFKIWDLELPCEPHIPQDFYRLFLVFFVSLVFQAFAVSIQHQQYSSQVDIDRIMRCVILHVYI